MTQKKRRKLVKDLSEAYRAVAPYASVGWVFVVSVTVSMALGWWLDTRIGTKPVFTLCGAFLGLGVGMYNLVVIVRELDKQAKKNKNNRIQKDKDPRS